MVRYERMVVKNRVHAAGKQTYLPQLATFKLKCCQQLSLGTELDVASWGAHTQFTFQKYPFFRPLSTPSGVLGSLFKLRQVQRLMGERL